MLSRAREARIELGVLPLLIGRISVVRAEFDGGEITLTRKATGATWVAFGPPGNPPDIIVPPAPAGETLEQSVVRLLDGLQTAFAPVGSAGGLKGVGVRNAHLTIVEESNDARWTADAANFALDRRGNALTLMANARLEGRARSGPGEPHHHHRHPFPSRHRAVWRAKRAPARALLAGRARAVRRPRRADDGDRAGRSRSPHRRQSL